MVRLQLTFGAAGLLTAALAAQQPAPAFEVASVRPNTGSDTSIPFGPTPPDGVNMVNRPLESLVRYAYDVQFFRVVGMPAWANVERFDINARASRSITIAERRLMLRTLLMERFGLKAAVPAPGRRQGARECRAPRRSHLRPLRTRIHRDRDGCLGTAPLLKGVDYSDNLLDEMTWGRSAGQEQIL
jgi:hypothetical protein